MTKIILASASAQRKNLLKDLGIPFSVVTSNVNEVEKIQTTCCALVKHNAVIKARDVAGKVKNGIVIGADTLVYGGNKKVIGKPRTLKEAKRILHSLSAKPHWVYTGVAVIDSETKRMITGYEKTKIFMRPMTDKEIDSYHRKVSPLDKSGGFDIEGRGGLFIRRIEGCYSNVIGLPLSKLTLMLKKMGVSIL